MTQPTRRDHNVVQTVAGAAVIAGATCVALNAIGNYRNSNPGRPWGMAQWASLFSFTVLVLPFIVLAIATGFAPLLFFATPGLLVAFFAWLSAINDPQRRTGPIHAEDERPITENEQIQQNLDTWFYRKRPR